MVHVNVIEAEAFVLLLRWLLRARGRQGHRVVVLLDSKVLLGAAAKGRSSARALNRLLRKAAALVLAGDLLLKLVFVPSRGELRRRPGGGGDVWKGEPWKGNMTK